MSQFQRLGLVWLCLLLVTVGCEEQTTMEKRTKTADDAAATDAGVDPPVTTANADIMEDPEITNVSGTDMDDAEDEDLNDKDVSNPFVPPSPDGDSKKKKKVVLEKREALTGPWHAVLTQDGVDLYIWLLEFSPSANGEKTKTVKVIDSMEESSALDSHEATDNGAKLVFSIGDDILDFEGKLKNGVVYGNVVLNGKYCNVMRLLPTRDKDLSPHASPDETTGVDELKKALTAADPYEGLKGFCEKHPENPLTLEMYKRLILESKKAGVGEDAVKGLVTDMIECASLWGTRMQLWSQIDVATLMAFSGTSPQLALDIFDKVEEGLPEELAGWNTRIVTGRNKAHIEIGLEELKNSDELISQAAYQKLQQLHEKNPFDPSLTYGLGNYAAKSGMADDALSLYAELTALPMMENLLPIDPTSGDKTPSELLTALWEKKHGSIDGLEDFVNEIYEKRIHSFAIEPVEQQASEAGNRVILCELFTGSECPPCVAADVATMGAEIRYSRNDLVVIRYHQHIPGPDPLTNEDGEARFSYYPLRGTPSVLLNGKQVEGVGGLFPQSVGSFDTLNREIDGLLSGNSDIQLELQTSGNGPEYNILTKVAGVSDADQELRLRIVVAERKIQFVAGNGIRFHEMVVRAMPGGAAGVKLTPDRREVQHTVNVEQLKSSLFKYLKAYEEGQDVEFPVKPLDLGNLEVVAFVQNDETREVLQVSTIPLTPMEVSAIKETNSGKRR